MGKCRDEMVMEHSKRFVDENKQLSDFYDEVWVVCPTCTSKAIAKTDTAIKKARMFCTQCGFNKEVSMMLDEHATLLAAAHTYFNATLWLQLPFRSKEVFFAYNGDHLLYLEQYIAAEIRETKNRTHFTLIEKLPKFYHDAKNRNDLLKIIQKLKLK
jgi:predicted RNA-binding Zn-ribbon protein involved in translation (DUF1610 family)